MPNMLDIINLPKIEYPRGQESTGVQETPDVHFVLVFVCKQRHQPVGGQEAPGVHFVLFFIAKRQKPAEGQEVPDA